MIGKDRRVLVVDDESPIRQALWLGLSDRGFQVQLAARGEEALDLAAQQPPDLVLLDLMLPDRSGIEVCTELRGWSQVPIIVLSGRARQSDKVQALDCGADDYLTKPFGLDELLARMRAVWRRTSSTPPSPVLESGALRLDRAAHLVTLDGQPVHLTPKEYELLRYLMLHAGKLVTHRLLLSAVWGAGYEDDTRLLRVFIAHLRRKVEPDPTHPTHILTEPGAGYRFRAEP